MSSPLAARPPPIRGLDVLFVTLAMPPLIVIAILAMLAVSLLPFPSGPEIGAVSVGGAAFGALVLVAAIFGSVYLIVVRRHGLRWSELGLGRIGRRSLALAVLTGVALVPVVSVIEALLGLSFEDSLIRLIAPEGFTWWGLIGAVVFLGVLTPIAEEVYFRGIVYGWLRNRWRAALAAPASAALFAATHFVYPWPMMLMVAGLGVVFALAYELSGSLWPPIAIHATYNSLGITLLFVMLA